MNGFNKTFVLAFYNSFLKIKIKKTLILDICIVVCKNVN